MRRVMRDMIKLGVVIDLFAAPIGILLSLTGRLIRRVGVDRMPITLGYPQAFWGFPYPRSLLRTAVQSCSLTQTS